MKINTELFGIADALNEKYIKVWEDICSAESPTDNKAAVDACGDYIAKWAYKQGFALEKLLIKKAGDPLCITLNENSNAKPIVFSGHIDTVHPIGLFGSPAVTTDRENDRIYGPGAADCKGGVVSAMMALEILKISGFTARPVMLLVQTDEEVSSTLSERATINWICEKAKNAEAFLNLETNSPGKACIVRKGIVRYKFTVFGKGAHSSLCYNGVNAITEAAHKIIELEKYKDKDGITCCCGTINGGTVANSVADTCTFTADFRLVDIGDLAKIEKIVDCVANTQYLANSRCEVKQISKRCPMEKNDRNFALLERINEINSAYGMKKLEWIMRSGGSDAADVSATGIPCIDSIGAQGDLIHTPDEYAVLSSLCASAKQLSVIAYSL